MDPVKKYLRDSDSFFTFPAMQNRSPQSRAPFQKIHIPNCKSFFSTQKKRTASFCFLNMGCVFFYTLPACPDESGIYPHTHRQSFK
jgi:hypothetical protein